MAVDINWSMLTNASANFGNALANAAGQVRQRRDRAQDREAVSNYLANPNDETAFRGAAARNPEMAFRLRDDQLQRARQLRADQREQLTFLGRLVRNVRDEAGYQQAVALARRSGIDVTGHETYDPNFVGQLQALDRQLNRVAPVTVAEGAQLVDPETGRVVASTPPRPRYYPVQPGGTLVLDPSYQGATAEQPQPAAPGPTEAPAFQPAPAGAPSEFAPSGNPLDPNMGPGGIVRVSSVEEAAALPSGTVFLMAGETTPRVRN